MCESKQTGVSVTPLWLHPCVAFLRRSSLMFLLPESYGWTVGILSVLSALGLNNSCSEDFIWCQLQGWSELSSLESLTHEQQGPHVGS